MPNTALEPTAVGAGSSAFAVHASPPPWLSLWSLSIMLIWIGASMRSLNRLHTEIKLLEHRQIQRLAHFNTNAPAAKLPPAHSPP